MLIPPLFVGTKGNIPLSLVFIMSGWGLLNGKPKLWEAKCFGCSLGVGVCACVCWGWERAVPVDTSNVKRAGSLTGAVTGIAGGSLSINPPSCQSNPLTVATRPLLSAQLSAQSRILS